MHVLDSAFLSIFMFEAFPDIVDGTDMNNFRMSACIGFISTYLSVFEIPRFNYFLHLRVLLVTELDIGLRLEVGMALLLEVGHVRGL